MRLKARVEKLADRIGGRTPDEPDPMNLLIDGLAEGGDLVAAVEAYADATDRTPEDVAAALDDLLASADVDDDIDAEGEC